MGIKSTQTNDKRWGDWLAAVLLIICLQIASGRLVATRWTEELHMVQLIAFIGTILGLALGISIYKRFWVIFFSIAYGIILIPWQIGLLLEREIEWHIRLENLLGRLEVIFQDLITRTPLTDNLLFLLLMAILFWIIAIYSGFVLIREGHSWKVVIPGGAAAFIIHSYDSLLFSRSWYLAFYLLFALLLVARLVYLRNNKKWHESHTHTPPDMGFDFTRSALIISLILVLFAWNIPVVAQSFKPTADIWRTASRPWLSAKDRFSFMFASLSASVGLVQNYYGNTLPLGLGNPLSDQIILEVDALTNPPNGYRYYWEARTYNVYKSGQWQSNLKIARELSPESEDLNQPGADVRPEVQTTFFPHIPISNLFTVPELLWIDRPTQANMIVNPDGTVNYGALMSKGFVYPGERYSIRSAIDAITVSDLQKAGTSYPDWVMDEYLQLPDNITPRTKALANEIAAGSDNPYDIVYAMTEYLRNNITYTQSISQPPPNQERIDWFLFDSKEGFCNYYASAEVILLRSVGIPARIAVGFAQGERQTAPIPADIPPGVSPNIMYGDIIENSTYVVRQKDAHAWPEVYFPGLGWVIFEPTVSQPPLFRPSGELLNNPDQNQTEQNPDNTNDPQSLSNNDLKKLDDPSSSISSGNANFWTISNIISLFILLFTTIMLVVVIWQVKRGFRVNPFLQRLSLELPEGLDKGLRKIGLRPPVFLVNWINYMEHPAISRSYQEINHALARIGRKPTVHDTPSERAMSLIQAIPDAAIPAEQLILEYQTSIYSPNQASLEVAQKAGSKIRYLSWLARIGRFIKRFQEPDHTH